MDRERRNRNGNNDPEENSGVGWFLGAAAVGTALAGLYLWSKNEAESQEPAASSSRVPPSTFTPSPSPRLNVTASHHNWNRLELLSDSDSDDGNGGIQLQGSNGRVRNRQEDISFSNLNSLLNCIYVNYVGVKYDEFRSNYNIFMDILRQLHSTMKQVDQYYGQYSCGFAHAGSHLDGLKIQKPDEFDVDFVINMPVSFSEHPFSPMDNDINLIPRRAGYVQLKMGPQFKKIPVKENSRINIVAYKWMDSDGYLLRSKFLEWFQSVVDKALSRWKWVCEVDGIKYSVTRSISGPAVTLRIANTLGDFNMDIDLVPALRFPESRWPLNSEYREIPPSCSTNYWLVVPKPDRYDLFDLLMISRSWRVAMQSQEGELIYKQENLKQTIRMIKKLRDASGLNEIASYYIKTLFFWEVTERNDPFFWRKSLAELFTIMVRRLYNAMVDGEIPYFWNRNNNLIEHVHRQLLNEYKVKLKKLIDILEDPARYEEVAGFLLKDFEYSEFKSGRALTIN